MIQRYAFAMFTVLAMGSACYADDKAIKEISGEWRLLSSQSPKRMLTTAAAKYYLTIDGEKVSWTDLPQVIEKAGEGTLTVGAEGKPNRIDIKVGDKTHKGICKLYKGADPSKNGLFLFIADQGKEPPKDFEGYAAPKGSKGVLLTFDRKPK